MSNCLSSDGEFVMNKLFLLRLVEGRVTVSVYLLQQMLKAACLQYNEYFV